MSRSIPAGGQMTPFDRASLSLRGWEPPPPTVGGSPLTSGGHVAPCSGDVFSVGCASPAPTGATPTNAAMIRMVVRKGNSSRTCRAWLSTSPGVKGSRGPAAASARVGVDFMGAKSRCCLLERGDSIGIETAWTGIVGTARSVARSKRTSRSKSGRNNAWPTAIPRS